MKQTKRGECLRMAERDNDYYVVGHALTDDEIWEAISDLNEECCGEDFAEADADLIRDMYELQLKREEWDRWGLCTCGDDHERDLYAAKPHARGAFPVTFVIIKVRESVVSRKTSTQDGVK
jgi:hypothetical protein